MFQQETNITNKEQNDKNNKFFYITGFDTNVDFQFLRLGILKKLAKTEFWNLVT
jgi:hypothetical protein